MTKVRCWQCGGSVLELNSKAEKMKHLNEAHKFINFDDWGLIEHITLEEIEK